MIFMMCLLLTTTALALSSDEAVREFDRANQEYKNGRYDAAVAGYEKILAGNLESGAVYYNLGNAYFKQGEEGKAILNYERALRLMPRDRDLLANYKFAASFVRHAARPMTFWERLWDRHIHFYTVDEMAVILLTVTILAGVIHLLSLYLGWPRGRVYRILGMCGFVFVLYGAGLLVKLKKDAGLGVVVTSTEARFEPRDAATVYFELPEGQAVRMLQTDGSWAKIERPDGKLGWVPSGAVEKI